MNFNHSCPDVQNIEACLEEKFPKPPFNADYCNELFVPSGLSIYSSLLMLHSTSSTY